MHRCCARQVIHHRSLPPPSHQPPITDPTTGHTLISFCPPSLPIPSFSSPLSSNLNRRPSNPFSRQPATQSCKLRTQHRPHYPSRLPRRHRRPYVGSAQPRQAVDSAEQHSSEEALGSKKPQAYQTADRSRRRAIIGAPLLAHPAL